MKTRIDAPPRTIDTSAVELHCPSPREIQQIIDQAAQYERPFVTTELPTSPIHWSERTRRGIGWYATHAAKSRVV